MTTLRIDRATAWSDKCAIVLRFEKLKSPSQVAVAAKHNKRSGKDHWRRAAEIDKALSHLNYVLHGPSSPEAVRKLALERLLVGTGRRVRRGTVRAIEAVVSLRPGTQINQGAYFAKALAWLIVNFGGEVNVVSADVHLDEGAPHMHVLIVPIIDGRANGSDLVGGPTKLRWWLDRFHSEVGVEFGLLRRAGRRDGTTLCSVGGAGGREALQAPSSGAAGVVHGEAR